MMERIGDGLERDKTGRDKMKCPKCGGDDTSKIVYLTNPPQHDCSVCGQSYYLPEED